MEHEIQSTHYYDLSKIPSDEDLIHAYESKNPYCNRELIRIWKTAQNSFVYQERNLIPVVIDRARENCFHLKEEIEDTFIYRYKDGSKPGYCKFVIKPYLNNNSILIVNSFMNGEKYQSSTSRYDENEEHLKDSNIKCFQYMAETIIAFCDRYKIIETQFDIQDLNYHVIDTNPFKYGYALQKKLEELFEAGRFKKIMG